MLSRQVLGCGSGKCCGTGRSSEDRLENRCRNQVPQARAQTIRGRAKFHRSAIAVATHGTPTPLAASPLPMQAEEHRRTGCFGSCHQCTNQAGRFRRQPVHDAGEPIYSRLQPVSVR
jgi:hypothetical protein